MTCLNTTIPGGYDEMGTTELVNAVMLNHNYQAIETYFITITLKPTVYKYSSMTQWELTVYHLLSAFDGVKCKYSLVAELTEAGNVHYHAIISSEKLSRITLMNKLKKTRNIGFIKLTANIIDHKDNMTRSAVYLVKDYAVTRRILSNNGYKPQFLFIK